MTVGSPNLAIALLAKLNAGHSAIAMAAHNQLAVKLAAEVGLDAVWESGFEPSDSYVVLDATHAVAG